MYIVLGSSCVLVVSFNDGKKLLWCIHAPKMLVDGVKKWIEQGPAVTHSKNLRTTRCYREFNSHPRRGMTHAPRPRFRPVHHVVVLITALNDVRSEEWHGFSGFRVVKSSGTRSGTAVKICFSATRVYLYVVRVSPQHQHQHQQKRTGFH